MPVEQPLNPPDPEDNCPVCGVWTGNGKVCDFCTNQHKADLDDDE